MKFGDYLRVKREAKGWTQPEAAAKAGIEQSYLSKLETGKSYPSEDVYTRLVAAYEIDPDDMVRQVASAELAKLREIGEVRTAVLDVQKSQRTLARGWLVGGLICLVGAGACLGLFLLARDHVETRWVYQSPGVLEEGEPLEAFDIVDRPLEGNDDGANSKQRDAMILRLNRRSFITSFDNGFGYVEKVEKGQRFYRFAHMVQVEERSPLRWFLIPALALLAAAAGCGGISFRWK